jgi:hypothetical protein
MDRDWGHFLLGFLCSFLFQGWILWAWIVSEGDDFGDGCMAGAAVELCFADIGILIAIIYILSIGVGFNWLVLGLFALFFGFLFYIVCIFVGICKRSF